MIKKLRLYQIGFFIITFAFIALCAYMGITAVQKSMRLNVGFSAVPSIKVLIQIEDPQAEGGYRTIFRNDANTQIGNGLRISGNTLSFTESFANAEPNIGASFVLKFTNLMTNTGLKVSEVGSSASADPTYVTMKASGNGVNTATMTISGSEVSTLQLLFSEYNAYTVSFSGGVTNTGSEIIGKEIYSTTLTVNNGYDVPSSVSITVGGVPIDANSYSYNPSNGALTINKEAITGDIVITAVSTLTQYTITYNLGDNVTNPNPTTYTVEDTITLQAPIKDGGYIFGGWTGSNGETPETSVTIPQGSTGNKTYTVSRWTLGDYTLMKGQGLNLAIKTELGYSSPEYYTVDSTVKSIIFGKYSTYASTVGAWTGGIAVDVDGDGVLNADGYIRMFLTNSNANCYILSDGNIDANPESTAISSYNSMFSNFSGVTSITFNNFDTANVTNMSQMFSGCNSLTSLNLSNFNTSTVSLMESMFRSCSSLTSLNLSNFNTTNVTRMREMFARCSSLASLDLSSFNTTNATNMSYMFSYCSGLQELDLSNFNTGNVVSMWSMFEYCSGLPSLSLSSLNTSNVTDMSSMFQGCSGLQELDLSNFNTSNVTDMDNMFCICRNLTKIYVSTLWSTAKLTSGTSSMGMFYGCTKLPNFNSSVVDKTNAHTNSGGYLTLKT